MKKYCKYLLIVVITSSCGSGDDPKVLAKKACDCWQEAKALQNSTAKARKADECTMVTQNALSDIREAGVRNNWNDEQVKKAEKEFDNIYDSCK